MEATKSHLFGEILLKFKISLAIYCHQIKLTTPMDDQSAKEKRNAITSLPERIFSTQVDALIFEELYAKIEFKSDMIGQNIEATLLNSEIYLRTIIINISIEPKEEKRSRLDDLRTEKLEDLKAKMDTQYEDYPEFLYTEAYLELQESITAANPALQLDKAKYGAAAITKALNAANKLKGFKIDRYKDLQRRLSAFAKRVQK
jgi:hypothetical protein